jgi:CHAD domain-containing protein
MRIDDFVGEQFKVLTTTLQGMQKSVRSDAIHDFRVAFKKLRSMARLLGHPQAVHPLRGFYRACAAVREPEILSGILAVIVRQTTVDANQLLTKLRRERLSAHRAVKKHAAAAADAVDAVQVVLTELRRVNADAALAKRINQRIRAIKRLVCSERSEIDEIETLHDVRKSLKEVHYLLVIQEGGSWKVNHRRRSLAHDAESFLGAVHDQYDLMVWLLRQDAAHLKARDRRFLVSHLNDLITEETQDAKRVLKWLCRDW